jgi:carbonic anhydrase/acetyltransferase-like protein (isoleucine patch superfamily)
MIQAFNGKRPVIAATAFVHETAVLIGDVKIGEGSSVWPNAVLRADYAPIRIGNRSHIEDCSVAAVLAPPCHGLIFLPR